MASIMKRGDSYSVRYKYKDHSGKPCEGWESFKTKKEAQERKITVEKELLDGTFLVPDTMTVEEMLYKGCFSEQRIDSVNRCCLLKFQFQVLRGCLRFSAANSS